MSGDRAGARLLRLVVPCAAVALYALWIRPGMLTWGATPEEATCTYRGIAHHRPGPGTLAGPTGWQHDVSLSYLKAR